MIFEPTFIEIIHHIDSTFWASTRKLIGTIWYLPIRLLCSSKHRVIFEFLTDFIYARKDELLNSPYVLRSANFTQKLDAIYKDFSKNDIVTNMKKYIGVIFDAVYEYYFSQIPFRKFYVLALLR